MKIGDLVWDTISNCCVVLVKKKTNIMYICFFSNKGQFLEIPRRELKQLTPKKLPNKNLYDKIW